MKYSIFTISSLALVITYINNLKLKTIMAKQTEIIEKLNTQATELSKVKLEVLNSLDQLKTAVDAQDNASPELVAAVEAIGVSVQSIDNLIPDATTSTTTQEESTTSSTTEDTTQPSTTETSTDAVVDASTEAPLV